MRGLRLCNVIKDIRDYCDFRDIKDLGKGNIWQG